MIQKMIRSLRHIFFFVVVIGLLSAGLVVWVSRMVHQKVDRYIYADPTEIPANPVGMVLGAEIIKNSIPSEALAYRLSAGVTLFQDGKVNVLLMSGDGRKPDYNEVEVMAGYAEKAGVPASAIREDPAGLRTYDSCLRAKEQFGLHTLTIITQKDHLLRAVYTCRQLGVEAIGFVAPDFSNGSLFDYTYDAYLLREKLALVLAWFQVNEGVD
ncbi:YdcF family protein [Patescibacteria group bacterium]|nr:YdcF family protein [Patescibacteria group bacterium]